MDNKYKLHVYIVDISDIDSINKCEENIRSDENSVEAMN